MILFNLITFTGVKSVGEWFATQCNPTKTSLTKYLWCLIKKRTMYGRIRKPLRFYTTLHNNINFYNNFLRFCFRHIPRTFVFPLTVDYRYFNRVMNWNNKHLRATIEIPLLVLKFSSCFICIGIPLPADCLCSVPDISVHVIF